MVPAEGGGGGSPSSCRAEQSPASPQPPQHHHSPPTAWERADGSGCSSGLWSTMDLQPQIPFPPGTYAAFLEITPPPPTHPCTPLLPPPPPPPAASRCSFGTRCPGCALTVPHRWALWGIRTPILALSSKHRHPRSASPPRMPPTRAAPRPTRTVSCGVAARRSRIPPGAPSSPARGGCGHGGRCVRGWAAPPPRSSAAPAAPLLGRVRIFSPGVGLRRDAVMEGCGEAWMREHRDAGNRDARA